MSKRNPKEKANLPVPHEASRYCGAHARSSGEPCKNPAGFKTDHVGEGRCHLHGGKTPIKHGRYSSVKREDIRALIEQHEADPDPLNILPELAAARALFQDFIERYDGWREAILAWHESYLTGSDHHEPKPRQILDIADAYRIVSEITKIVERVEKIRTTARVVHVMEEDMRRRLENVRDAVVPFIPSEDRFAAGEAMKEAFLRPV